MKGKLNSSKYRLTGFFLAFILILLGHTNTFAAPAADSKFDHDNTGFIISGAHQRQACDACHIKGVFKGTPTSCQGCHAGGLVNARPKSNNHIQSNNMCDDCHTENIFANARMDHAAITGSCASCHNGVTATGKSPNHIRSNNLCEDCHSTRAWSPVRLDHSAVTGTCSSCHNGVIATGKHPTHTVTPNTCEDCHNTSNWNVARFDHSGISQPCANCHLKDRPPSPHTTNNDCAACHTPTNWLNVTNFDHGSVAPGTCAQVGCHINDKNPGHFNTSLSCDACHSTSGWRIAVRYSHTTPNYPTPDHPSNVTCTTCHTTNSSTIVWENASYKPDCAGCHADTFNSKTPDKHMLYETPKTYYNAGQLRDCTTSCHQWKDSSQTQQINKSDTQPGEHGTNKGW